ncbi:transposase family protein [Spiroplasma endosymbiont of Asaphidion curtum]|uniref:transposase family protein n=1 Tax=Spiroplasma endosymbiont of Asaphidion curtum TaxID=3066281 RepID=UPI00313CB406
MRPKLLFSGKKRQHSLKSQIIIDLFNNKIISVDFCYGSIHDYKLFLKSNTLINPKLELIADSGYQGLQNVHKNTLDLVHNYNILHLPNYKIHFHLYIYLIFVLHLENNIIKIVDKIEGYVPSLLLPIKKSKNNPLNPDKKK